MGSGVTILVHLLFFSFPLCKLSLPFRFKFLDFLHTERKKIKFSYLSFRSYVLILLERKKTIMPLIVSQESLCLQCIHSDKLADIFQLLYPVERSFKDCYIVIFFIFLFNNWLSKLSYQLHIKSYLHVKIWAGSVINKWNL